MTRSHPDCASSLTVRLPRRGGGRPGGGTGCGCAEAQGEEAKWGPGGGGGPLWV